MENLKDLEFLHRFSERIEIAGRCKTWLPAAQQLGLIKVGVQ